MISKTKQEWFDAAWQRSKLKVRSGRGSRSEFTCTYSAQSPEVPGCFIGVSLPPDLAEKLDKVIPGSTFSLIFDVTDLSDDDAGNFIGNLQVIHDQVHPDDWEERLREFAARWMLQVPDLQA